jgi:hypothetical protein
MPATLAASLACNWSPFRNPPERARALLVPDQDPVRADCGFDFSSEELHYYLEQTATQFRPLQTRPDFDKAIAGYRAAQKEPQAA